MPLGASATAPQAQSITGPSGEIGMAARDSHSWKARNTTSTIGDSSSSAAKPLAVRRPCFHCAVATAQENAAAPAPGTPDVVAQRSVGRLPDGNSSRKAPRPLAWAPGSPGAGIAPRYCWPVGRPLCPGVARVGFYIVSCHYHLHLRYEVGGQ